MNPQKTPGKDLVLHFISSSQTNIICCIEATISTKIDKCESTNFTARGDLTINPKQVSMAPKIGHMSVKKKEKKMGVVSIFGSNLGESEEKKTLDVNDYFKDEFDVKHDVPTLFLDNYMDLCDNRQQRKLCDFKESLHTLVERTVDYSFYD